MVYKKKKIILVRKLGNKRLTFQKKKIMEVGRQKIQGDKKASSYSTHKGALVKEKRTHHEKIQS